MANPYDPIDSLSQLVAIARVLPQPAFADPIVHMRTLGGPDDPSDRRLVLRREDIEAMLNVVRSVPSGALVIHGFGLVVKTHRANGGHQYESVMLVGSKLEPLATPF